MAAAGLAPPRLLTLAITGRCDLSCAHCLVEAGPRAGTPVPAETVLRVVAELVALGGRELRLTGGEPLLHPRWRDVVAGCCAEAGLELVVLQTNGAALEDADARALRELGRDRLSIQVSLDGASPRTHDAVRGRGAFERTLQGLGRLCGAGLGERVTLAFTEMRHNMGDVPALLELVARLGLGGLVGSTLVVDGRAARAGVALPAPEDYRALLDRYRSSPRFRALYDAHGTLPALEWWKGRDGEGTACCTFGAEPYLGADGLLRPCPLSRSAEVAIPGAHARPLGEVLQAAIPGWAALQETKRRRHRSLPACAGCPGLRHCGGGCLGRAHAARGAVDAVEDRCDLRKAVYHWRGDPPRAEPSVPPTR
jgi:radical SAM protein with 4Fe4S-binding SPASM domain